MTDLVRRIASLPADKRALLEQRLLREAPSGPSGPRLSRRNAVEAPLSFAQLRLWFLDQLAPGSSLYNVPEVLALHGPLDAGALERALQRVVERHEILRTSYGGGNGEPRARVEPVGIALRVTELAGPSRARRVEEARAVAAAEAEEPFDLRRAPMLRARLLRVDPEEHWLLLTMHHIASDEWSMGALFGELSELYSAEISGHVGELPALPIQYSDYSIWQREWLDGDVLRASVDYWKRRLAGDLPVLDLPTDRPRPPRQTFGGAEHRRRLSRRLTEGLETFCRREGVTPFMALLAAFQILLSRYSGQDDVLVGTPIAGRNRIETEGLIGFFVNTLVLRADVSADPTFRSFLRSVRETVLEAFTWQDLPFDRLVEELRPERSLAYSPIFQAMFEFDGAEGARLELEGLEVEPIELPDTSAKFDLRLLAVSEDEGMLLVFEYATDLFEEPTIARMAANFETLLDGILADADRPVSRLPMLATAERRRLLVEWNQTEAEYPRDQCVHTLFEAQARATPDAVAIVSGEESLTYGELDRKSGQLARRLRELGVGPEVLVGLRLPRSPQMAVGLFGILRAGGAYVPLDPFYPSERLAWMLEDSGVEVLVTLDSSGDSLPEFAGRIVRLDADAEAIFRGDEEVVDPGVTPENLAYMMYTSGSTGRPKGIMVPHRGLVNYLSWCLRAYDIAGGLGAPVQSPLSFDLTVTSLFGPLLCGRRVCLVPAGFATEALGSVLRSESDFSLVKLTPTRLDLLTQEISRDNAAGRTRAFVVGGEPLRAESLKFWRESAPQTAIFNEYGPTETVVGCTVYRVAPGDPSIGAVPIGRPIANTRMYVLDRHGDPVPTGVTGELSIGGEGVARGYWKRPDLTAERFVPDPFAGSPGARLYRTGDLARYRADGNLEFLGRRDDQVKIRGFRVELAEIETAVREHSSVQDAAAALREEIPGDQRLVAYVVPKDGLPWSPEAVREHLIDRLPEYMIPSAIVRLDALPVTSNGKLDRKALPSPDWSKRQLDAEYTPPRDGLELHLARLWEAALGTGPIGVDDDFFELGGHSLLAVRLFAEIEKVTGKKLPLATLFQAPTVGQLAEVLRERGWSSTWSSLVPIQPRGTLPPFFCVHAVGGGVLLYRALSRRLGADQPFYGLQARGFEGDAAPPARVEEMAASYLREVQSVQPEGPYYLGGWSAGGLVAFEMARQLSARGERVALLALFDTWSPRHGKIIPSRFLQLGFSKLQRRLRRFARRVTQGGLRDKLDYLREKVEVRVQVFLGKDPDLPDELQRLRRSIEQATEDYEPEGPYPGRAVVFWATGQPTEYVVDRTLGWEALARGGVEVHEVPGYHGDIFVEPHAVVLAEELRKCLSEAVRRERGKAAAPPRAVSGSAGP